MRLQKHEQAGVRAIVEVARDHGLEARLIRRGKHPVKVRLTGPGGTRVIGVSSSPRDRDQAAWVARKQARLAARAIETVIVEKGIEAGAGGACDDRARGGSCHPASHPAYPQPASASSSFLPLSIIAP